jgi:hypothetical protein
VVSLTDSGRGVQRLRLLRGFALANQFGVAVILFVILITEYEQGRDLFGMGCAIPCMAGMLIMGLIAAVGSLGNPFKGSPPHDGGADT